MAPLFPAGPRAVLVRRHDGHGAAGPDPSAGGPQQGGGRLQSAAESEEQVADPDQAPPLAQAPPLGPAGPRCRPPAGLCVQTRDPDASSQHMWRCVRQ